MEHETLGAEVLAETEAGMPQLDFSIYPNLIFWLVLSLGALYLILTRVAVPRIAGVLADRSDAITDDLEEAALHKRRAAEAETAYNAALAQAREESQRITAATKADINAELGVLMAKADAEIAARAAESEARIGAIQAGAATSIEEVARATARELVAALVPSTADDGAVAAAVTNRLKG